jgi:membrane protein implicated in regulation of membrane protease activity
VDSLLEEPAAILVMITIAALLLVVEAALPTAGIAGTGALLLSVGAVVAVERQDATWWPLLGPATAVMLWSVMVARRSRPVAAQAAAAVLFGAGSVAFAAMADSPATAIIGVLSAVALAAAFPTLHGAARRLLERPTQVGMDSLVGRPGEVVAWTGADGTVRVEGSLWTARAAHPLRPGDHIAVVSFTGMTLEVVPSPDRGGGDLNSKESTWKQ